MTLKDVRKKTGLSQAEFAKTLGVSSSAVSNVECGLRKPSSNIKEAIKKVYGEVIDAGTAAAKPAEKKTKPAAKKAKPAQKKEKPADAKAEPAFAYRMSILKSEDPDGNCCGRYTYCYEPEAGLGHFIHTYECDGNPLPTFAGEPERVAVPEDIDEFTELLWHNLNSANKISLYVRYIDPVSGKYEERLVNKHA